MEDKITQSVNSKFYAEHIAPRTCAICGGQIRPAADWMTGEWWMLSSHKMAWRCGSCSFTGTFSDFCDEADKITTMPDFESVPA